MSDTRDLAALIEACGEFSLHKFPGKTFCFNAAIPLEATRQSEGATPEEALARLLEEIRKKAPS